MATDNVARGLAAHALSVAVAGGGGSGGSTIPVLELAKYCQFKDSDINTTKQIFFTEQKFNEIVEIIGDAPIIKVKTDMLEQRPADEDGNRLQVDIPCMVMNSGEFSLGGSSPAHFIRIMSMDIQYMSQANPGVLVSRSYRYLDLSVGFMYGTYGMEGGIYQYKRTIAE